MALGGEELALGVRIVCFHEARWVDPCSYKIDGLDANLLPHLDAVACAVLANGGGHAHQVGLMLGMQRILD